MVAVIGEAGVALRPETGKFASEAERDISGTMPGVAKKAAGFFAAAFAAVGVGKFLANAVTQATDLSESASKVKVVFGDSAASVEEFASTASTSLGLSEAAALGAAGTFGNLLRSVGLTDKASADMSTSMIGLAGDLASFNNVTPEEALDALRSGLVGETEPLKAFGVNMNEAALSAKAVELGLAGAGETLDANAKAQAAYALIMEQTSLAQGDFARTSAGLANQQRIATAQFQDLSANVGGLFVPVLANAAGLVTGKLMPALLHLTENLPEVGEALGAVGDYFRIGFEGGLDAVFKANADTQGFAHTITTIAGNVGDLSAVFREAFVDGAANSANLGAGGLLGFAVTAGDAASRIRDSFGAAWEALTGQLGPVIAGLQTTLGDAAGSLMETFSGAFGGGGGEGGPFSFLTGIADAIGPLLETVGPMIGDYITRWSSVIQALIPAIVTVVETLVPVITDLFTQIGPVIEALLPVVSQVADVFATTLVTVIEALVPVLPPLVEAIGQVAGVLAGAFLSVLQAIAPVLPVLVEAFASIATVVAGALLQVLQALAPILPQLAEAFAGIAVAVAGALTGALAALLPVIPPLLDMLLQLVLAVVIPLLPLLPMLADLFLTLVEALAPIIPPVIEIVALLLQLAMQVITPLLPIITTLIEMFVGIVQAIMPIITIGIRIIAFFMELRAKIVAAVLGLVVGAIEKFGELIDWLGGLPGKILSGLGDLGGLLLDAGADLMHGLVEGIAGAATFVGNAAKNIVNAVIGFINDKLIDGINNLLEFEIAGVSIDVPDIPHIPKLHSGGVFDTGSAEGLALLRRQERVVTPEQRIIADNLLRDLLSGRLDTATTAGGGGGGLTLHEHIHQAPGEPVGAVAARVTQDVVWKLNGGITRTVAGEANL